MTRPRHKVDPGSFQGKRPKDSSKCNYLQHDYVISQTRSTTSSASSFPLQSPRNQNLCHKLNLCAPGPHIHFLTGTMATTPRPDMGVRVQISSSKCDSWLLASPPLLPSQVLQFGNTSGCEPMSTGDAMILHAAHRERQVFGRKPTQNIPTPTC